MKKRIIKVTIFILMFFVIFGVKAVESRYSISGVNSNVEKYNNAVKQIKNLKCNDGEITNQVTVDKCNTLIRQKYRAVAYLYNAKSFNSDLNTDQAAKIMQDNSESCTSAISSDIQEALNKVFLLFYIAGPILLLVFGSLDFTKAIVSGDERKRKAIYRNFIRRCIALALLFVSPMLVRLLINTLGSSNLPKNTYVCSYESKKVTISYTPVIRTSGPSGKNYGASTGSSVVKLSGESDRDAGEYVIVNNSFPGSVRGFSDLVISNGVCQTSTGLNKACISSKDAPNGWGDCCAGIAQIQACGYKKGISLTQSNSGLIVGNKGCNNPVNSLGCSGVWDFKSSTCFNTESEYVRYVIENIQNGTPVFTVAGTDSRHFITIVGFKKGSDGNSHEDLLILDSWDGRLETFKKRKLGKRSKIGNHPCRDYGGEYWASPLKY